MFKEQNLSNSIYQDNTFIREDEIAGEAPWIWTRGDSGAWDGPKSDWENSHQNKYFKHVKKYDCVVTAGGNHGIHARFYSKLFKAVYVFEPDPMNFHCLVQNAQYDNVIKMQAALGDKPKLISLNNEHRGNTGAYTVNEHVPGIIPCITLDSLDLPSCDLLQLDVEDYELSVLLGAYNTIIEYRPVVILENGHKDHIADYMRALHYVQADQSVSDAIWVPEG